MQQAGGLHACARQVEATKFTEVGFHGRDVDQIIRDLVDAAIVSTRAKLKRQLRGEIGGAVEDRILDSLLGADGPATTRVRAPRHTPSGPLQGGCQEGF